jgi:hypothetical protein
MEFIVGQVMLKLLNIMTSSYIILYPHWYPRYIPEKKKKTKKNNVSLISQHISYIRAFTSWFTLCPKTAMVIHHLWLAWSELFFYMEQSHFVGLAKVMKVAIPNGQSCSLKPSWKIHVFYSYTIPLNFCMATMEFLVIDYVPTPSKKRRDFATASPSTSRCNAPCVWLTAECPSRQSPPAGAWGCTARCHHATRSRGAMVKRVGTTGGWDVP